MASVKASDATRWWQRHPKQFTDKIGDALASGQRGRIGVAWAIILTTGGSKHGDIADAARKFGIREKDFPGNLSGKRHWTEGLFEQIASVTGFPFTSFLSGAHILAVSVGENGAILEPGDEGWEVAYRACRMTHPTMDTENKLRSKYPQLFEQE